MNFILLLLQLLRVRSMDNNTENDNTDDKNIKSDTEDNTCNQHNYRRDLLMGVFILPVIGVFIPGVDKAIHNGLIILNQIPDWFSLIIVLAVISIFGFRKQLFDILSSFRKK